MGGTHSHPGPGSTRFPVDGKLTLLSSIFEPNRCQLLFVLNVEESMFIMNDVLGGKVLPPGPPKKGLVVDTIPATKVLLQIWKSQGRAFCFVIL